MSNKYFCDCFRAGAIAILFAMAHDPDLTGAAHRITSIAASGYIAYLLVFCTTPHPRREP